MLRMTRGSERRAVITDRQTTVGTGTPSCEYCGFAASKLYAVATVRRAAEQRELAVCHFCYLRLRGIRPTRSALVNPARRSVPLG